MLLCDTLKQEKKSDATFMIETNNLMVSRYVFITHLQQQNYTFLIFNILLK
jgi:hypothetical protein